MLQIISSILFVLLSLLAAYGLGLFINNLRKNEILTFSSVLLLGIFSQIILIYLCKLIGLNWDITTALVLPFGFYGIEALSKNYRKIFRFNWNFTFWFIVHLIIGLTILNGTDGISTYWRNNYGDGAFHIGMISNFAFGDNYPPEYQIFPGAKLTYPFFINLWTSFFWQFYPTSRNLAFTFAWQWILIWVLTFNLLKGSRFHLLPWAVLLGGGAITLFPWNEPLWQKIDQGYVWTQLLDSIWIPQRNAMFAIPFVIAALTNFYRRNYLFSGIFFSSLLACHAYFAIPVCALLGIQILIRLIKRRANITTFFVGLIFCIPVLIWLSSKADVFIYQPGALFPEELFTSFTSKGKFVEVLGLVFSNFYAIILISLVFIYFPGKVYSTLAIIAVIIFTCLFKLSPWFFDQSKIFVGIWLCLLALATNLKIREYRILEYILLILLIPGIVSTLNLFKEDGESKIFNKESFSKAEEIRKNTKSTDIIMGEPDPNSIVLLAGRKLYLGYGGTLWTHSIKSEERSEFVRNLSNLNKCKEVTCPTYFLWSDSERRKHPEFNPDIIFSKTALPYLYKINK